MKIRFSVLGFLLTSSAVLSTYADDTEIFRAANDAEITRPNVLLILDNSGSMANNLVNTRDQKIEVLRRSVSTILDDLNGVNVGLMRFNEPGASILFPVTNLDAPGIRDQLKQAVQNTQADIQATPVVDSLYEASLYFRGDLVDFGKTRRNGDALNKGELEFSFRSTPDERQRVSVAESLISGRLQLADGCRLDNLGDDDCIFNQLVNDPIDEAPRYRSPIISACQRNFIVLLTDGVSNGNNSIDRAESLTGSACSRNTSSNINSEVCGTELARFLANTEQIDNFPNSMVNLFTIGFGLSNNSNDRKAVSYLQSLVTPDNGNGIFFPANSEIDLTNSFRTIFDEVNDVGFTFVVPGATVSQFNRATNFEDVFFSVFRPSLRASWAGNLKKYKFGSNSARPDTIGQLVGQRDVLAVNPMTGFFADNVKGFFSQADDPIDGADIAKGGVAGRLPETIMLNATNRKVFAYYNGASKDLKSNPFATSNDDITEDMLGLNDGDGGRNGNGRNGNGNGNGNGNNKTNLNRIINWMRGQEVSGKDSNGDDDFDDARQFIGDPLHSEPVAIQYDVVDPDGGGAQPARPKFFVFFATNEGFLHAIDGDTGEEKFAFVPEAVMKNFPTIFNNPQVSINTRPYGLDGSITPWVMDVNSDGVIDADAGDHVYLYFGMRRGGNFIYALDVTDLDNPQLLWQLDGNATTGRLASFGQTWSKPTKARVAIANGNNSIVKDVIIVGAGYDIGNDTKNRADRIADTTGNAIFMIDAESPGAEEGAIAPNIIWSGSLSTATGHDQAFGEMQYSFPSQVIAGDTTGDGLVNVMFAADVGGQIWRFDVNNGNAPASLVDGGVVFDAFASDDDNDPTTPNNNYRRFYGGVDVASVILNGNLFFNISAGSGWRANPLDDNVVDRFYAIRIPFSNPNRLYGNLDPDLLGGDPMNPRDPPPLKESDLIFASSLILPNVNDMATRELRAQLVNPGSNGFFIDFSNAGEKVLSASVTAAAQVFFATYQPPTDINQTCTGVVGSGRLYGLNLFNGSTVFFNEDTGVPEKSLNLASGTIPASPSIIVLPDGTKIRVGVENGRDLDFKSVNQTFWFNLD